MRRLCRPNLQANDPAEVIVLAHRDLKTSRKLLVIGLACAAAIALLVLIVRPKLSWVDWFTYKEYFTGGWRLRVHPIRALVGVPPTLVLLTACYGLGRGARLLVRARIRLAAAHRMQQLPGARVV